MVLWECGKGGFQVGVTSPLPNEWPGKVLLPENEPKALLIKCLKIKKYPFKIDFFEKIILFRHLPLAKFLIIKASLLTFQKFEVRSRPTKKTWTTFENFQEADCD